MSLTKTSHPYDLLQEMDIHCTKMADAFPNEIKVSEYWKGIGFILGGNKYITPWSEVAEIQSLPSLTRVPGAKEWVKGVANVRGTLLPVMDLNIFFGFRSRNLRKRRLLVVKHDGIYSGLIVDEVIGALSFEEFEEMTAMPAVEQSLAEFITGGFNKQDVDWPIFSLHALAEYPEFRTVTR